MICVQHARWTPDVRLISAFDDSIYKSLNGTALFLSNNYIRMDSKDVYDFTDKYIYKAMT